MTGKKKVFIIVSVLRDGGGQRSAANISLELQEDYDVSFVTFSADNAAYTYGGTLYDLHLPRKRGLVGRTLNDFRRAMALRKLKKKLKPDVCISFLDDANLPNVLSRGIGETIVTLHTHLSSRPMGRLTKMKVCYAYAHADKVVAVSRAGLDDLVQLGYAKRDKCSVIGNMVDGEALLRKAGAVPSIEKKGPVIATMGSLVAQKGMWNLLRAFKTVQQEFPEASLLLFGGGNKEPYEKLIRDLDLKEHVTIMGFVKDPHALLAQADLFVFPTRFEGLPNALLEAMALGLPVISTDSLTGPREILDPESDLTRRATSIEHAPYGILIPVPKGDFLDAQAVQTHEEGLMAQAICEMLSDQAMRSMYAKRAKERAQDYSPAKIKQSWEQLIGI